MARYSLLSEHISFFTKHGAIDFEELITEAEADCLKKGASTYNLWQQSEECKKIIAEKRLGKIAGELTSSKTIILAFDQKLEPGHYSLQTMSCLRPLVCGLLLNLVSRKGSFVADAFFLKEPALLIAYGGERTLYTLNPSDPHTHLLKKQGYVFGDVVNSSTHPVVCY